MAQYQYTPDTNDQYEGFSALPACEYKVQVSDTDIVSPKSGDGQMLKIVFEVVADAKFDGRKIFDNIMLEHSNADAVRIGKQKLNTICALTATRSMKDTAQLHGKTLSLLIGIKKDNNGNDSNIIKKYLPFDSDGQEQEEESPAQSKKPSFIKK